MGDPSVIVKNIPISIDTKITGLLYFAAVFAGIAMSGFMVIKKCTT